MKPFLPLLLFALCTWPAAAHAQSNLQLKYELDSLYEVDQRYRAMLFDPQLNSKPDSLAAALGMPVSKLNATLGERMRQADARNLARVKAILQQHGYPGKSLVGVPTNEAAWHVVQHNPAFIPQYLPLIKAAADRGELPFPRYGTMLDRQLVTEGKAQRYGTQLQNFNGQPPFVWPIENPAQVNQLRRQAGFTQTVEQYAATFGTTYRVLTLADVARLRQP